MSIRVIQEQINKKKDVPDSICIRRLEGALVDLHNDMKKKDKKIENLEDNIEELKKKIFNLEKEIYPSRNDINMYPC